MDTVDHLIVGAGYVGRRLAERLRPSGRVAAIVATSASALALRANGVAAQAINLDDPAGASNPSALYVYYLAPPPSAGVVEPRLARFLELGLRPQRFMYLSTTAVYGNTHGASVDENSPTLPQTDRGKRRLDAEEQVRRYADSVGIEWCILRVPGIYGPERLPLDRLARGEPVLADDEAGLTNRIHVTDLVTALVLVAQHPDAAGRIYNVTDGAPSSTSAHFRRIAQIAGLPPPPIVSRREAVGRISPAFLSYLDESRRLDGSRLVNELGFQLRYADPDEGIRASLPDQTGRATKS
jgi:nucleoside-diphosphate-sugar epimerase